MRYEPGDPRAGRPGQLLDDGGAVVANVVGLNEEVEFPRVRPGGTRFALADLDLDAAEPYEARDVTGTMRFRVHPDGRVERLG